MEETIKRRIDKINTKLDYKKNIEIEYSLKKMLSYFIIYSILGFLAETIYGLLTKGVLESRQSMLYGPFCCIYGLGAVCLIYFPNKSKSSNIKLFLHGVVIGSIVEYIVSWIGEYVFYIRWWDYSNYPFNINGRICLLFSVFWGILTVILNKSINPRINKTLKNVESKISRKTSNTILIITITFIIVDLLVTCFALKMFFTRVIYENKIENVVGVESYYSEYLQIYQKDNTIKKIINTLFSDKKMLKTFPNIKLILEDGEIILVKDILTDIQPYYFKIFEPKLPITAN